MKKLLEIHTSITCIYFGSSYFFPIEENIYIIFFLRSTEVGFTGEHYCCCGSLGLWGSTHNDLPEEGRAACTPSDGQRATDDTLQAKTLLLQPRLRSSPPAHLTCSALPCLALLCFTASICLPTLYLTLLLHGFILPFPYFHKLFCFSFSALICWPSTGFCYVQKYWL